MNQKLKKTLSLILCLTALAGLSLGTFAATAGSNNGSVKSAQSPQQKVSINKGTVVELASLPFIGEAKAKRILDYRKAHGPFKSIEDLTKVKGIGSKTLAKLKAHITL